jgi:hypothetical protein
MRFPGARIIVFALLDSYIVYYCAADGRLIAGRLGEASGANSERVKIKSLIHNNPQYGIAYEATAIIILLPCRQQCSN